MRKLYRDKSTLHPVLQWTAAAVCAAAYFLCCLPSFRLIGRFALQMLLSVVLSAGCTAVFFFALPRSLRVIGKALSLFLLAMLTLALVGQVQEQIRLGGYPGWAHTFFYDRPLTVAVVWATGFILLSALRLFLPYRPELAPLREDYARFFKDASGVFLLFYTCVLVYCFLLQRSPGGESGVNLIPFAMIFSYFGTMSFAYESIFYMIGNLLCFFPFGFYYRIRKKRADLLLTVLMPVVLSLLIEASQLLFGMGDFDVDDILMNAFGFYFGYVLSFLCDKLRAAITAGEEATVFPQ